MCTRWPALIPAAGTTSAHIVMNGVKISETWKSSVAYGTQVYSYRQISDPLPNFPQFGGEVIAKVPGVEVYFGEWAPRKTGVQPDNSTDLNLTSANRTVFYAGENATTAMPTLVNAKYDVVGIKRFDPSAPSVSSGTLNVNYGGSAGTIAGSIAGGAGTVNFNGTNIASNGSFQNTGSTIKGQFYGAGAEAMAGIYNNGTASASVVFISALPASSHSRVCAVEGTSSMTNCKPVMREIRLSRSTFKPTHWSSLSLKM